MDEIDEMRNKLGNMLFCPMCSSSLTPSADGKRRGCSQRHLEIVWVLDSEGDHHLEILAQIGSEGSEEVILDPSRRRL